MSEKNKDEDVEAAIGMVVRSVREEQKHFLQLRRECPHYEPVWDDCEHKKAMCSDCTINDCPLG